jgi:membrane-associated phospholipid phosphatase
LIREAVWRSALLCGLFMVVYSGTNWLTSLRSDVGKIYFSWEEMIPFVPLMVIPYMSIDLFFVAAPFLCRDRRELSIFSKRIVLTVVLAGICFLLFPLRLAHERPQMTGWMGAAFGWFFQADLPYNLCPSLHIGLRTVLAEIYARHTRGAWNVASHLWFSLIGFSTLLTHQHHIIDIAGGFLLALVVFYLVPSVRHTSQLVPNRRVGALYLVFAALCGAIGFCRLPWTAICLWPMTSCLIAAGGYFWWGNGIYRKIDGRLTLPTRLLMAPNLFGQWLSRLYYQKQCRPWDPVTSHVWIGRHLNDREAELAVSQGVTAVLDLTAEFSEAQAFLRTRYRNVPILDLTAPTEEQLTQCLTFLQAESAHGVVYVHCKIGYSRSAAVVGAWLLQSGEVATADAAMSRLREVRPSIVIRPEAEAVLHSRAASRA